MKIKELKKLVDLAYKESSHGNADIEVWVEFKHQPPVVCKITKIGQFNLIPDMIITVKPEDEI